MRSDSQSTRGEIGRGTGSVESGGRRECGRRRRSSRVPRQRRHEDGRRRRELLLLCWSKTDRCWAASSAERRRHPEVWLPRLDRLIGATRHLRHRRAVRTDARRHGPRIQDRERQCENECPAEAHHDVAMVAPNQRECQTTGGRNATRVPAMAYASVWRGSARDADSARVVPGSRSSDRFDFVADWMSLDESRLSTRSRGETKHTRRRR